LTLREPTQVSPLSTTISCSSSLATCSFRSLTSPSSRNVPPEPTLPSQSATVLASPAAPTSPAVITPTPLFCPARTFPLFSSSCALLPSAFRSTLFSATTASLNEAIALQPSDTLSPRHGLDDSCCSLAFLPGTSGRSQPLDGVEQLGIFLECLYPRPASTSFSPCKSPPLSPAVDLAMHASPCSLGEPNGSSSSSSSTYPPLVINAVPLRADQLVSPCVEPGRVRATSETGRGR
jgi:hypothetical protein